MSFVHEMLVRRVVSTCKVWRKDVQDVEVSSRQTFEQEWKECPKKLVYRGRCVRVGVQEYVCNRRRVTARS